MDPRPPKIQIACSSACTAVIAALGGVGLDPSLNWVRFPEPTFPPYNMWTPHLRLGPQILHLIVLIGDWNVDGVDDTNRLSMNIEWPAYMSIVVGVMQTLQRKAARMSPG